MEIFDLPWSQRGQGRVLRIARRPALADRLHVRRIDAFLQRQEAVERDRPGAVVGHRIGEQEDLDLVLGETAAVNLSSSGE